MKLPSSIQAVSRGRCNHAIDPRLFAKSRSRAEARFIFDAIRALLECLALVSCKTPAVFLFKTKTAVISIETGNLCFQIVLGSVEWPRARESRVKILQGNKTKSLCGSKSIIRRNCSALSRISLCYSVNSGKES